MAYVFEWPDEGMPVAHFLAEGAEGSQFQHVFGGAKPYEGATPPDGPQPVHLVLRLDTADPRVGVTLGHARFLPLFYPFRYDCAPLEYHVRSDSQIEILRMDSRPWSRDFPYVDYPANFPEVPIRLSSPERVDDGFDDAAWTEKMGHYREPTVPEILAEWACLKQGYPHLVCSACEEVDFRILTLIDDEMINDVFFFWPDRAEEYTELMYLICPKCKLIRVAQNH